MPSHPTLTVPPVEAMRGRSRRIRETQEHEMAAKLQQEGGRTARQHLPRCP